MNYFSQHWTFDPTILLVVATVALHEVGLSRLAQRAAPERTRRRRRLSWFFYSGLVVFLLVVTSPVDYWSSRYFFVHMIEHVFLCFAVPILVVAGAPWLPLMFSLPVVARRKVGRFFYLSARAGGLRTVGRFIRHPWTAVISFNAVMLFWHIPSMFELAESNSFVHIVAMHGSFVVTGVLFWLQIIPSYPMKPARGPVWQGAAVLGTNAVMTVLAMAMSFLTSVSWYTNYSHLPGVTLSPFADQQIGAAILWVCGDFWALPALNIIVRRAIKEDGSFSAVLDRLVHRSPDTSMERFLASRAPGGSPLPVDATGES